MTFPKAVRHAAWKRCRGHCENKDCGAPLDGGRHEYDHIIARGIAGGNDTLANCQVLCLRCHRAKSANDVAAIAKSNRIKKREAEFPKLQSIRSLRERQHDDKS